ncbi:MAG: flavodoxin domain-containing protein [Anaerolineales bacterium]|jgi:menaquinone-dependent protoporphyrinogen oxidase
MKKILVTYATMAGSTAEVADAINKSLTEKGYMLDLMPIQDVANLESYDAVVVGGPMILGWHRLARRFVRKHSAALAHIPFAVFATAMSLTESNQDSIDGIPVFIDERLAKPPSDPARLTLRERYASLANYRRPILRAAHPAKPSSIAMFGGRLNYGRLKWWAVLFALVLVRAQAGDKRNWEAINKWASSLPEVLGLES